MDSRTWKSEQFIPWNIATRIFDLKMKYSSYLYFMGSKTPTNIMSSSYNLIVIVQTDQLAILVTR